jgi:hypothetical protein
MFNTLSSYYSVLYWFFWNSSEGKHCYQKYERIKDFDHSRKKKKIEDILKMYTTVTM